MKRLISIVALSIAVVTTSQAQSVLGGLLGGGSSSSSQAAQTVGNIIQGLAGTVYTATPSLNGTYTYNGIAVSVSAMEGDVASTVAGTALTSGIETKIDGVLAKVGIKPGAMTVVFNASDNSFVWTVAGVPLNGNYKVGDGEKTVTLTFGKSMQYLSMTGTLESTLTGARLMFASDKATAFLKQAAKKLGETNNEIGSIAKLADGYDNYKIGFKLTK